MANILISDDDRTIQKILFDMITDMGHVVSVSSDGLHTYKTLKENERFFDLLIADLMMPKMDGRQLLQTLRKDTRFQNLPVIILSSFLADLHGALLLKNMGPVKCLSKPVSEHTLQSTINELLGLEE